MSDPRWTVDEEIGRLRYEPDPVIRLADMVNYEGRLDPDEEPVYIESIRPAYDALVECVRSHDQVGVLADALRHIAGDQQCETYTGNSYCRTPGSGRSRDSEYGATRWCDTCIARSALEDAGDVRSHDTLTRARQLARTVVDGREGGFSTREFAFKAELALLDLLTGEGQ